LALASDQVRSGYDLRYLRHSILSDRIGIAVILEEFSDESRAIARAVNPGSIIHRVYSNPY